MNKTFIPVKCVRNILNYFGEVSHVLIDVFPEGHNVRIFSNNTGEIIQFTATSKSIDYLKGLSPFNGYTIKIIEFDKFEGINYIRGLSYFNSEQDLFDYYESIEFFGHVEEKLLYKDIETGIWRDIVFNVHRGESSIYNNKIPVTALTQEGGVIAEGFIYNM